MFKEDKVIKSEGLNESERILSTLGEKVFLKLWSYPNTFYRQGKELVDLLVICGEHVILFSDKKIKFNNEISKSVAWERWQNKAIIKSIKQLRKAENKIRNFPDKIYLDAQCTKKLPIIVPKTKDLKIHLICVANGISDACKNYFGGGNGSLLFTTLSDERKKNFKEFIEDLEEKGIDTRGSNKDSLFFITDYDRNKTFVHVFDDFSLPFIFKELDTISDFIRYLDEKEAFIRSRKDLIYMGEEDLLYHYIRNYDEKRKQHTFPFIDEKMKDSFIVLSEENWNDLYFHPQYIAKKQEDKISYAWDDLIQRTADRMLKGDMFYEDNALQIHHEGAIRYMALEDRVTRRFLCKRMYSAFDNYPIHMQKNDVDVPYVSFIYLDSNRDQVYFFLQLMRLPTDTYDTYRKKRRDLLKAYAMCLQAKFVEELPHNPLKRIIAIALEPPKYCNSFSEDFLMLDCSLWNEKAQKKYSKLRRDMNIWRTKIAEAPRMEVKDFPDTINKNKKVGRNEPCICDSGLKYKKCCGR